MLPHSVWSELTSGHGVLFCHVVIVISTTAHRKPWRDPKVVLNSSEDRMKVHRVSNVAGSIVFSRSIFGKRVVAKTTRLEKRKSGLDSSQWHGHIALGACMWQPTSYAYSIDNPVSGDMRMSKRSKIEFPMTHVWTRKRMWPHVVPLRLFAYSTLIGLRY